MASPHPPHPGVGTDGLAPYAGRGRHEHAPVEYPHNLGAPGSVFTAMPGIENAPQAAYPGFPPAPPAHPRRRGKRLLVGALVTIAVAAALTTAIVFGVRTNGANTAGAFSERSAKTAIQGYLDALEDRDVETIVRNALCGIYDSVRDKRSDQALAKLSSDAFRKQFSKANVTSIDKIVYWSQYQAQVLFTMEVTPGTGGPPKGEVQGIAQLLYQRGQIMVCSYVLRTAGQY